jgi:two-component system copper resistance phosphate regulon response regulator CusR
MRSAFRAGHPGWRRCSSLACSDSARSWRLASRTPRTEIREQVTVIAHEVAKQRGLFVRILVVEDEMKFASALKEGLESEKYEVTLASTGEDAFFLVSAQSFDVVILDVMLPGRDGFEILTAIRRRGIVTPVLLLTARDAIEDRVAGLDAGADDYLPKPFAFAELLARIRALARRGRADRVMELKAADLEMDLLAREATRAGRLLPLTPREFELLEYLVRHRGQIVSRDMLARDVWRETSRGTPLDNVIDVHIAHLRKKVDQAHSSKLLHTVHGVGFVLKEERP